MGTPELEDLLAHDAWMRRLARGLVRDGGLAEDLVQDAWVAILSLGRARGDGSRSWLGGVVRNLRRQSARGEARRARREEAAARPEAAPSEDAIAAELQLRKDVTDALLLLAEPYRRTVFQRFFQDRSLTDIAREDGVAVSTVHARLRNGLASLRSELDRRHGGQRQAWAVGLLSLARAPAGGALSSSAGGASAATTLGGVTMGSGLKLAVAVVVLGGALSALMWDRAEGDVRPVGHVAVAQEVQLSAPPAPVPSAPATLPRRELQGAHSEPAPEAATIVVARLEGLLVDTAGRPLAGIEVGFTRAAADVVEERARTDASGRFELDLESDVKGQAAVHDALYVLVTSLRDDQTGLRLVAGLGRRFAGVVVDEAGTPVGGAEVSVRLRNALFRSLGVLRPFDAHEDPWSTRTAVDGTFLFEGAIGGESARLEVEADGFEPTRIVLPEHDDTSLIVSLARPSKARTIRGFVLSELDEPVGGARVSAGNEIVRSRVDGSFEVPWGSSGTDGKVLSEDEDGTWSMQEVETHLTATHPDHGPTRIPLEEPLLDGPVMLRLAQVAQVIEGVVLDAEGQPWEAVVVWIQDPTPLGRERISSGEGVAIYGTDVEVDAGGSGVWTDADGRFRLGGLLERDYRVQVFDPRSVSVGAGWELAAGTRDAELLLELEPSATRVAGHLLSLAGEPLEGIAISVDRSAHFSSRDAAPPRTSEAVMTDANGAFDLGSIAIENTVLSLRGERLFMYRRGLPRTGALDELEFFVPRLCELQVEASEGAGALDELRVLDGDGKELELLQSYGAFLSMDTKAKIEAGRSSVVQVDERAETALLYHRGEEVRRLPVRLSALELTVLRP